MKKSLIINCELGDIENRIKIAKLKKNSFKNYLADCTEKIILFGKEEHLNKNKTAIKCRIKHESPNLLGISKYSTSICLLFPPPFYSAPHLCGSLKCSISNCSQWPSPFFCPTSFHLPRSPAHGGFWGIHFSLHVSQLLFSNLQVNFHLLLHSSHPNRSSFTFGSLQSNTHSLNSEIQFPIGSPKSSSTPWMEDFICCKIWPPTGTHGGLRFVLFDCGPNPPTPKT